MSEAVAELRQAVRILLEACAVSRQPGDLLRLRRRFPGRGGGSPDRWSSRRICPRSPWPSLNWGRDNCPRRRTPTRACHADRPRALVVRVRPWRFRALPRPFLGCRAHLRGGRGGRSRSEEHRQSSPEAHLAGSRAAVARTDAFRAGRRRKSLADQQSGADSFSRRLVSSSRQKKSPRLGHWPKAWPPKSPPSRRLTARSSKARSR